MRLHRAVVIILVCLTLGACAQPFPGTETPGPAFYTALAIVRTDEVSTATPSGILGPSPTHTLTAPDGATSTAPTIATPRATAPPPTVVAPPTPVAPAAPVLYETTVTLLTYDYPAAFIETDPDDPVYPYPRLDFTQIGSAEPHSYRAVVLENGYVSVTILPELGGRIYRWVDKATGRNLLYENRVVQPKPGGARGWWLSVGGIEWAFPIGERGLNEWRPWAYSSAYAAHGLSVTVSDTDDRTGLAVGVTISLDTDHAYVTLQPWVRNDSDVALEYQFWLAAMLTLGKDTISGETEFLIPTERVVIRTSGDARLPGPGEEMTWPVFDGRDLSRYGNWERRLGFFVPELSSGYVGLYDRETDQGIVRAIIPGVPLGSGLFGLGGASPRRDESSYIELLSGATSSFDSSASLNPGESARWTELWYPISGLGAFDYANQLAALRLRIDEDGAQVGVAVTAHTRGRLSMWAGGQLVADWPINLHPGGAFTAHWSRPGAADQPLGLRFEDSGGLVLAQIGDVP